MNRTVYLRTIVFYFFSLEFHYWLVVDINQQIMIGLSKIILFDKAIVFAVYIIRNCNDFFIRLTAMMLHNNEEVPCLARKRNTRLF